MSGIIAKETETIILLREHKEPLDKEIDALLNEISDLKIQLNIKANRVAALRNKLELYNDLIFRLKSSTD
jgi:peptidoglycan hydrolase CwlO-like protein